MHAIRRVSAPISLLLIVAFLDATIQPALVRAQQAESADAPPSNLQPLDEATYEAESLEALSSHLDSTGAAAAEQPEVPATDEDVTRALAALPTGGGSVSPQATALPSGAATQLGMGESFTTQLSTGGAAYTLPINMPSARGAAQPSLSVSYNSAGGFGIAGVGWSVGVPAIARQTDRGLPTYQDEATWQAQQDRFTFGGMELVPICTVQGTTCTSVGPMPMGEVMPVWANGWQYFRPRIEGAFLRFFWSPNHRTWRVQGKDGTNLELGVPLDGTGYEGGLQTNPDEPNEVFSWHLVRYYDSQGGANLGSGNPTPTNVVVYRYTHDGDAIYLSDIFDTSPAANPTTLDLSQYAHHTRLVYEGRPDVTTSYRQGWYTEHALRLARIDVTSKPFTGTTTAPRELVRRYHFGYDPQSHRSLLTSAQIEGRCGTVLEDASQALPVSECPRLPPMRFEYQKAATHAAPLLDNQGFAFTAFAETVEMMADSPPHSLDEAATELADVNGDGLPDVLVTAGGLYDGRHGVYWNGLTSGNERGFQQLCTMRVQSSGDVVDANVLSFDNPNVSALDVDSDGLLNLLHMPRANSYSVVTPKKVGEGRCDYEWQVRDAVTLERDDVKINFTGDARNVRVMDVNGDGLVDITYSSPTQLQTFLSLGRLPGGEDQFGNGRFLTASTAELSNEPIQTCTPWSSTPVRFSDPDVQLADMNGDGLTDIVRARSGQILYWPGRGNGFFGTGDRDDCGTSGFAVDRHIEMFSAPHFGAARAGTLMFSDVSGDGLADIVEVRAQGVDIYLNDNGLAFTDRHIISDTPFLPAASNYVRLTDINGSGTPDILWGAAYDYQYIDLTGGVTPDLLVTVHNGLGKSFHLEYEPSTAQMLDAEAANEKWDSLAPVVVPVLKQTTVRDNLERIGRPAGIYTTEYKYRDPYYEGRQREFRGFREAVVTTLGDANSPTGHARTTFLLGECPEAENGTASGACGIGERWRDNWREALKGLPVVVESFDNLGTYLGTEHTTYTLRQLYTGLDGRRVVVPHGTGKDGFIYDTATFDGAVSFVALADVMLDLDAPNGGIDASETRQLRVRATAGTARVRSVTDFDSFGNTLLATRLGCVSGCTNGVDETIYAESAFALPSGDGSGWLYRELTSSVYGSQRTARRYQMRHTYDARGQVLQTFSTLNGTLPLSRSALGTTAVPDQSSGFSSSVEIALTTNTYDPQFGHATFVRTPNNRCSSGEMDTLYQNLPVTARVNAGTIDSGTGCGTRAFAHTVTYNRGLELVLTSTDAQGQPSTFSYDGFGRLEAATHVDPSMPGQLAAHPAVRLEYVLPSSEATPYAMVRARTLVGANPNIPEYTESWAISDSLGREIGTLSPADPADGTWVVSGASVYDAKGAPSRAYKPYFAGGTPQSWISNYVAPSGSFSSRQYDAFGRGTWSYVAGQPKSHAVYRALSSDVWDAEDLNSGGEHADTPASSISNGHGQVVQQVSRIVTNQSLEQHVTLFDYLPTGENYRIIRRRAGSADVVRWMRYDSLGRMVLNVEPNTTAGFTSDPDTASPPAGFRYAYNDSGDIVGYSDARGCGSNFHYDSGGRLLAEDRARCMAEQPAYSAPNLATGDGSEVFYRYDISDPDSASVVDAAGNQLQMDTAHPELIWGRTVSVSSIGTKLLARYDALGRITGGAMRIQRPGLSSSSLTSRYAPRWYVTTTILDAASRPRSISTGATVPELLGSGNQSILTYSYTPSGNIGAVGGSYGTLFAGSRHRADNLATEVTLGDAAATRRTLSYDEEDRLHTVQTFRGNLPLWSNPPAGSNYSVPLVTDAPTLQLLLEDSDFEYDRVNNIKRIDDLRLPEEWPVHAKPVARTFRYDDLYRLENAGFEYSGGGAWRSPFHAESTDASRVQPVPHVSPSARVLSQDWVYDHLGNIVQSVDDENAFWDRSTGDRVHQSSTAGPDRVVSASSRTLAPGSTRKGDLSVGYDTSGNMTALIVRRDGPCIPASASCWQRFEYQWNEVGQLSRARRWDLRTSPVNERVNHDGLAEVAPARLADADLSFSYDGAGRRVLKTATDTVGVQRHTVYVSGTIELRSVLWTGSDYEMSAANTSLRVPAGPVTARVVYLPSSDPFQSMGRRHVFLQVGDFLGSTSMVIDKETSELVEMATYQPYGAAETDYRPERWDSYREAYKFTGKEEDIEVGLQYFGARYYSPYLSTWMSPDPVTIHDARGDLNPYAYVAGRPTAAVDPDGRLPVPVITGLISMGLYVVGARANNQAITIRGAVAAFASGAIGGMGGGVPGALGAYAAGSVIGGSRMTAAGFASSTVGAAVGGSFSGGESLGATLGGAAASSAASYGAAAVLTGEGSVRDLALSVGMGMAGAMAGHGARALAAPSPKEAAAQVSRPSGSSQDQSAQSSAPCGADGCAASERVAGGWGVPIVKRIALKAIPKEGIEIAAAKTAKGMQKAQRLFANKNDALNWAKQKLGDTATRTYNAKGQWDGWKNAAGESVNWNHNDWIHGPGISKYPHINYEIGGVEGHLYLQDKIVGAGMWDGFVKEFGLTVQAGHLIMETVIEIFIPNNVIPVFILDPTPFLHILQPPPPTA